MLTPEHIFQALAFPVYNRQRVMVLLHTGDADHLAQQLFDKGGLGSFPKALSLQSKTGEPSTCVRFTNGAWVAFFPCGSVKPDEYLGEIDLVFWADRSGDYSFVKYRDWKALALLGDPWKPPTGTPVEVPKGERTVWERLDEDDF